MKGKSEMGGQSRWRPLFVLIAVFALGSVLVYFASVNPPSIRPTSAPATSSAGALFEGGERASGRGAGQTNYRSQCATCHGTTGKGDGWRAWLFRLKMGDFTDSAYMQTLPDEYLFQIIKQGGANLGKPGMPSWGQELTDQEIEGLVVYLRNLASQRQQPQPSGASR
ncbi:MAG: c-type cytochrome [Candidatus Methylomirabilis sp.]